MRPFRWRLVRDVASISILVVAGALGGVVLVAALDRDPPRTDVTGRSLHPAYHVGEPFQGEWRLTFARDCPGSVTRWATSRADPNLIAYLPSENVNAGTVLPNTIPAIITVPVAPWIVPSMPEGPADYHLAGAFACNWVQRLIPAFRITVEYPSIPFTVLASPPPR